MSKSPATEVCLIHLKVPYNLKDPSIPKGAIWASSISTLKKSAGFRDIYTRSVVEDRTRARMFLNKSLFSLPLPPHPRQGVPEQAAVETGTKSSETSTGAASTKKISELSSILSEQL